LTIAADGSHDHEDPSGILLSEVDSGVTDDDSTIEESPRDAAETPSRRTSVRRSTSHLKAVPPTLPERERIKVAAEEYARDLDKSQPFTRDQLEGHARKLLAKLSEPESYLGFTMMMIGSFF